MQDNLTELMSSRICHDLISPVGAIGNGLELMNALAGPSPELELVGQSAQSAQAKLKFFRLAFGADSENLIGGSEAAQMAEDMFSAARLNVRFTQSWGDRERRLVKLLYLLLLCVESSLPRGGRVSCTPTVSGWALDVSNTPVAAPEPLWEHVESGTNGFEVSAKTIQFSLVRPCMLAQSITLTTAFSDTSLHVSF